MLTQQQAPSSRGLPPLFTSLTRLLFSPMAAMAMIMKNLLSSFRGRNTAPDTPRDVQRVVTTEAQMNHRMNRGKAFFFFFFP